MSKRILFFFIVLALMLVAVIAVPAAAQTSTCPYAPAPRLVGASQGQVAQSYSSLRAGLGSNVVLRVMPGGATFNITGSPVCWGAHYWYPVTYQGVNGWATEGYLNQYWLEPVSATPTPTMTPTPIVTPTPTTPGTGGQIPPTDPLTGAPIIPTTAACPGAPAPRLVAGQPAAVSQAYSSLRAGVHSDRVLAIMRTGARIEVLAGPFCSWGPYNWYQVRYNGVTGWSTEGTGGAYWLMPLARSS